jgi:hypothetical protein
VHSQFLAIRVGEKRECALVAGSCVCQDFVAHRLPLAPGASRWIRTADLPNVTMRDGFETDRSISAAARISSPEAKSD